MRILLYKQHEQDPHWKETPEYISNASRFWNNTQKIRFERIKITPMPNTQEAVERRAHDNKAEDFHHILAAVKTFAPKGPLSVLSLGSGFGQVAQALGMHRCRTANLDYLFKLLSTGKKQPHNYLGTNFINADAKSIPFKDKTFDIVVSGHFLHSGLADIRKDEEKMLQEAHRCLKPGGLLVLDRANSSAASEKKLEESGFETLLNQRTRENHVDISGIPLFRYPYEDRTIVLKKTN